MLGASALGSRPLGSGAGVYTPATGGPTVISLDPAVIFNLTAEVSQNLITHVPTAASLTHTAQSVQNRLSASFTVATANAQAQSITYLAAMLVELAAAGLSHTASAVQLATLAGLSAAGLSQTAQGVTPATLLMASAASANLAAQDVTQATSKLIELTLAACSQAASAITVTYTSATVATARQFRGIIGAIRGVIQNGNEE